MLTIELLISATLALNPGALPPRETPPDEELREPKLLPVDPAAARDCGPPGKICFFPARGAVIRTDVVQESGPALTTLSRVAQLAASGGARSGDAGAPWDIKLVANLRRKTVKGTVLVLAYDRSDPQAIAKREVTGIWNVTMSPTSTLGLQVRIDPEAGFRPYRTYLVRIVQVLGRREVILAEADVRLE